MKVIFIEMPRIQKTKFGDDFQELNKTMIKDCVHEHLQLYSSAATI